MKLKFFLSLAIAMLVFAPAELSAAKEQNPKAVTDLLQRVTKAADKFVTVLDSELATKANEEVFIIGSQDGKPCIQGSTLSALTTGINWYLNHTARVNIAWNQPSVDLSAISLPLPTGEERHATTAPYRYYLNYCTFSYSMSVWTWERWQQEIDWMALHGINMPLQIVGLDVVWYDLLVKDLKYSKADANKFIAGPCFQAWWGMNNLEGWGGPNPEWWYERQRELADKILTRQRELGMEPVLPGYSGMVPSDITQKKGYAANNQGNWCSFVRPYILDPNSKAFAEVAKLYYERLEDVMGTSRYYSMDPFHEGANTTGIDVPSAYRKIGDAMTAARSDAQWVIQFWQWSGDQYHVLSQIAKGKLIVLDLYSDAHSHFGDYKGHDAIYCILPNFGGRTGFFGRLGKVMTDYFTQKRNNANLKGIGATPEAIEQVPVLYDALFELPWRSTAPNEEQWVNDYATARYGQQNALAQEAWQKLSRSSLACPTSLQGPMEAVLCARPALSVGSVSSWGGTGIFYDPQEVAAAAHLLLQSGLQCENMSYDLTDIARQALTDYGYYLLKAINQAYTQGDKATYRQRRDAYLQLILDLDELLSTNSNFMLGRWTQLARGIADEAEGTTEADRQWLELYNARTIITTWGDRAQAEGGGLRDYSYREWAGMLKDYYYPRWKQFFDGIEKNQWSHDWFAMERAWALNANLQYSNTPQGNTYEVAATMLAKHFISLQGNDGTTRYAYRAMSNDFTGALSCNAYRGESFTAPVSDSEGLTVGIDLNGDGAITEAEQFGTATITIPATAATGRVKATVSLSDGTSVQFAVLLRDHITQARQVSVSSADEKAGKATIQGSTATEAESTEAVSIQAKANSGYDFLHWADSEGNVISTANPYTYYGAAEAHFVAHFQINKWGTPQQDMSEYQTIVDYGQYASLITFTPSDGDAQSVYTADACPDKLFQTTQTATAAAGSQFKVAWKDAGTNGFGYCRLSAYIDLNADGDFNDKGECLGTMGNKGAQNSVLQNASLTILLPYDIPQGITHIRLRFDGAWQTDGLNATTDAKPANAKTLRMVYDIPLSIVEHSPRAAQVTVQTGDSKQGTVDANGQPDTYIYGVGEKIILRSYPADGYELDHWTDQYGRPVPQQWQKGNFLEFYAPESGTYKAHFRSNKTLAAGEWTFKYEDAPNGVRLLAVNEGSGALDLSATNSTGKDITEIDATVFQGCTALTAITLPATLTTMDRFTDTDVQGNGTQNVPITLPRTLAKGKPWTITLSATNSGATFNQWGSGLLATGTDALANTYDGGFQLYLAKGGSLILKTGGSENRFSNTVGDRFTLTLSYNGSGKLTAQLTNAGGKKETKTVSHTMNAIAALCTALPQGIDITRLCIDDPHLGSKPFRGTTELTAIHVAEGNALFSSIDGKLYDKAGKVLLHTPAKWGTTDGITDVNATEGSNRYYDLGGRRHTTPQRGINITPQGKKILKTASSF